VASGATGSVLHRTSCAIQTYINLTFLFFKLNEPALNKAHAKITIYVSSTLTQQHNFNRRHTNILISPPHHLTASASHKIATSPTPQPQPHLPPLPPPYQCVPQPQTTTTTTRDDDQGQGLGKFYFFFLYH
jgi:hypothetical protein